MALSKETLEKYREIFAQFAEDNHLALDPDKITRHLETIFQGAQPIEGNHKARNACTVDATNTDDYYLKKYNTFYIIALQDGLMANGINAINQHRATPGVSFDTLKNFENMMRGVFQECFYPHIQERLHLKDYCFGNLSTRQMSGLEGLYDKFTEANIYKRQKSNDTALKDLTAWEDGREFLTVYPAGGNVLPKDDWMTNACVRYKLVFASYNQKWFFGKYLTREGWKERHTLERLQTAIESVREEKNIPFARLISNYADASALDLGEYHQAVSQVEAVVVDSTMEDPDTDLLNHPKETNATELDDELYNDGLEDELDNSPRKNITLDLKEEDEKVEEINTDTVPEKENVIGMSEKDN